MSQNQNLGNLGQVLTVNAASNTVSVNSQITVGNTTMHSTGITVGNTSLHSSGLTINGTAINTTSFAGTANNTLYVGSVTAANVVSNAQLQANVTTLQGQITSNASAAYTNAVSYTDTVIGTANTAMTANAAAAYTNSVSYTDSKILTANSAITGNAATAYSNATTFASNASNISSGTVAEARLPYRMNQNVRNSDSVEFSGMTLTGNLVVSGNVNIIGANNLSVSDNMIYLNSNNDVSNPDIGVAGNYNDGTYAHTGIFRDATDGIWKVFDNYGPEPDSSVYIDTSNTSFHLANFQANTFYAGNTSSNWFVANTGGTYVTGTVNAASHTVGTSFIANSSGVYHSVNTFNHGTLLYGNGANVGIGTNSPGTKLDVIGSVNSTLLRIGQTTAANNSYEDYTSLDFVLSNEVSQISGNPAARISAFLERNNNGFGLDLFTRYNASTLSRVMRLSADGLVSIGNTSPGNKLAVWGGSLSGGSASTYALTIGNNGGNIGDLTFGSDASYSYIQTWNSKSLIINNQGNGVGIGGAPSFKLDVNGQFRAQSDMRATLFYDTDNTAYYVNPSSTSVLGDALTINSTTDQQITINSTDSNWCYLGYSWNGTRKGFIGVDSSGNHIWGMDSGSYYYTNGGYFVAAGSSRAPLFYDSNDTSFYVNPNGISIMSEIQTGSTYDYVPVKSHTFSDFVNGTLVVTNIDASQTAGDSFVLEATGKSYSSNPPFNFMVQGYIYNNSFINYSGINNGYAGFSYVKILSYNGNLAFWWPRVSYWNSFEVRVRNAGGNSQNRVTSITDAVEPSSSKKVTVTMFTGAIYNMNTNVGDLYAGTYYDTNDTSYYANPNSTSSFNSINYYNLNYQGDGNYGFKGTNVYADTINSGAVGDPLELCYHRGAYTTTGGSMRAPIFYDSDNTGYYADPASSSYVNVLGAATRIYTGYDSGVTGSVSCSAWFRSSDSTGWYNATYGGGIWMSDSTYVRTYGSKQFYVDNASWGTIFYDANDSGYYCDPNGTTRLNDFIVKGMWADNVLIADLSGSGASTIESTTCFTSGTYRAYEIQFQVVPGTMSAGIYMQFYVGGAWRTAAGDYRTYSAIWNAGGSQGYGPNSYIDIGCGGRARNYAGLTGFASIVFPSRTDTMPIMTGIAGMWDSTIDGGNKINFTGLLSFNSAISGFRIYASSGTISGYVKVYGRR